MTNLDRKATCCRSDLRFLLSLLEDSPHREKVQGRLLQIQGSPTNEQLTAAWNMAAIIHEQIRKQK
jgi:hypothetical protein